MNRTITTAVLTMFCACAGQACAATEPLNITPEEHAACDDDAARLCSAAYPNETKMLGCMKVNLNKLSPICLATFKAGMLRRHLSL